MRRGLIVVSAVTLLILCFAAAAGAVGPTRAPLENEAIALRGVCPFRVKLTPVVDREILTEFPNGHSLVTGRLVVRVTNMRNHASLLVDASGPATFLFRDDSLLLRARGRSLLVLFPGDVRPGSKGALLLVNGLLVELFDPGGLTVVRLPHNRHNLCRALA